MSLFDYLDVYKTTPANEIRKISSLLKTKVIYYGSTAFVNLFVELFPSSLFAAYEPSFSEFLNTFVFADFDATNKEKTEFLQYRYYCELLLNLLNVNAEIGFKNSVAEEINQLKRMIDNGTSGCGLKLVRDKNNHIVTMKKDEKAEAIAAINKEFKEPIFDYLIAKTIKEKESALTSLSIKLEAIKSDDSFFKTNKEFVQLLRHKEEKKRDNKYSWFFVEKNYEKNLDDLFELLLAMISHKKGVSISKEFKSKSGGNIK